MFGTPRLFVDKSYTSTYGVQKQGLIKAQLNCLGLVRRWFHLKGYRLNMFFTSENISAL
jgi:hypothetical protein